MSKSFVKELQELVAANIITSSTAQEITAYYQQRQKDKPGRLSAVVNILGALLVSLGVMLVLAHNWDELSKTVKAFIAFLPLIIGQGLCLYVLLKRKTSPAWLEPAGVVLFFAVAASISLISQTYHISGTMSSFLLTWMLLTLPLVYLLPSALVALLYIAGSTWYACEAGYFNYNNNTPPFYYLLLMALVAPCYITYWKNKRDSPFFPLLNWSVVLSVSIVLGSFATDLDNSDWVFTGYLALFAVMYLLGELTQTAGTKLIAKPFTLTGVLGIIGLLIYWSFDWPWMAEYAGSLRGHRAVFASPFFYFTVVALLVTAWLLVSRYLQDKANAFDPMGISGFVLFLLLLTGRNAPHLAMIAVNLWILFLAVFFIRKGALQDHLGILNFGLVIIASLAVLRFFDDQIPFIWRGLFFLVTGIGFFSANYLMVKKRKAIAKK